MELITRKSLLYKSGLGFYAINHVQGCSHGCRYPCYAWMMAHSHRRVQSWDDWCSPKLVSNAYEILKKELTRMKTKPDLVHLCLSTDPFMTGYPEISAMSLKLIRLMNLFNIRCSILSKGILPAELADHKHYPAKNTCGISLVSLSEDFRTQWEPGSSPYQERIAALKYLHENGCCTLAHIEPYPTPNIFQQNLEPILEAVDFVGQIMFSGWNYNPRVKEFEGYQQFYREQAAIVRRFCNEHRIAVSA